MLRVRILGALDAVLEANGTDEAPDLGGPRQRSVLALLLVARGQVVSVDRLVEDLWNGEPPPKALGALQAYVSHLRRALEPQRAPRTPAVVLVSEPPGYAIRLPVDAVDAWCFESLVRQANEASDPHVARELLDRALGLWRGPAYAEFATEAWAVAEAARLDGLRILARERWCEAVLRAGAATDAVLAAEVLTIQNPLREEGWRLLAMSLYASGRQADALTALRRARDILADELGLDPGPALLQVETDVLTQRLAIPVARARPEPAPAVQAAEEELRHDGEPPPRPAADTVPAGPVPTGPVPTEQTNRPVTSGDTPDLYGRDTELNALHAVAADAGSRPDCRVVLIAGEAGAGKSALVDQFARELSANHWRVVIGRCPESAGAPPAWAWVEALRALSVEIDPGQLSPALAPLLDEKSTTARESDASFGRFLLGRAVTTYLSTAARSRPLAIVLDDLHRGDSETLALLDSVAAAVSGVPLLLIAAYRPAEVQPGLRDALAGLAALPPTRMTIGGLDRAHAARLIRAIAGVQPDDDTLSALVERTGGNAFYLAESARLLGSEGRLVATSKVREGVRDVLRRRFARLPEITVSVLRLAAVIGREVDIDVLVRAAEVDEETVLDALEAGVMAGLLTEPAPDSVRFAHVLVRDTLYDDAPRLRQSRWHARIATALAEIRPGDLAALAHHFHQAGTASTARSAVNAGVRAADQAVARYAHDTAAALYAQALADLDRVPETDSDPGSPAPDRVGEQVELLARLSLSQLAGGAGIAANQSRSRALTLADRAGRLDLLIRALTAWDLPTPWLNRTYGVIDRQVVTLIERVLQSGDPLVTPAARTRLLCALVAEIAGEQTDAAHAAAREAIQIARRLGDPVLIGLSLHALCAVVSPELEPVERLEINRELLEIGRQPGLAVFSLIGHHSMVQVHGANGDHRRMAEHIEDMQRLITQYRWRQAEGIVAMHRATIAHLTGRLDEAEAIYSMAAERIRSSGALDAEGIIMLAFLTIRITQGRAGEMEAVGHTVDSKATDVIAELLALVVLQQGRPDDARQIRGAIRPIRRDFFRSLFLTLRGMLVIGLAERAEAAGLYPELLPYRGQVAGAGTGSFAAGPVDTVLGDLAAFLGRPADARDHYRSALALAQRCGCEPWVRQARERLSEIESKTPRTLL
jgi:DNA-binding SARP family transcriptional activator